MIDHISVSVRDIAKSTRFYEAVLGPLGYTKLEERAGTVAFGKTYTEFWLNARPGMTPHLDSGAHVALRAPDTKAVDAFHDAARAGGGASDGKPGLRAQYGEGYYAAFIRDLDGNRIEAVTFLTPGSR